MKPTVTVESLGSVWLIDETSSTYLRMPKHEGPRPNGWGDETQGALQDLAWHTFASWNVVTDVLVIRGTESGTIYAPKAVVR